MLMFVRRFIAVPSKTVEFARLHSSAPDLQSLRRSLIYRSGNLGMLELDIVIGRWAKQHVSEFTQEQCERYVEQVLACETPDLYRMILGADESPTEDPAHYINAIKRAVGR